MSQQEATLNQRSDMLRAMLKNKWIRANFILDDEHNEDYWYDCTKISFRKNRYFWAILPHEKKLWFFLNSIGLKPTNPRQYVENTSKT